MGSGERGGGKPCVLRISKTTIAKGGAEMVGGRVLAFQRDGGGRTGGERTAAAGQQGRETEGGGGSQWTLEPLAWGEREGGQETR